MEHITEFCSLSLYTISAPKEGLPAWPHHRSFPAVRSAGRTAQIVLSRSFCKTVLRLTSHVEVGRVRPPAGVGRAGPSSQMSGQADPSIGVGRAGPPLQGSGEPDPLSQGSGESDPLYRQRWGTASRYMPFNCNVNVPHRIIFYLAALQCC